VKLIAAVLTAWSCFAQSAEEWPSGPRITPPTIASVSPQGIARGNTLEMNIEGFNLARTSAIYFSEPGVKGKIVRIKELPDVPEVRLGSNGGVSSIDLGPLPPRNQVTVEIEVAASAQIGPVNFRLLTPLGTSPAGTFLIEPFYGETNDAEPNDSADNATEVFLPAIFVGAISRNGDIDTYKFKARAGQEIVFENGAMQLGSTLQPLVRILREDQTVLAEFGGDGPDSVRHFAHKFAAEGTYYLQITDFQQSGRGSHTYRLKAGDFPIVTGVYPLGLAQGATGQVKLEGYRVPETPLTVKGVASEKDEFASIVRPELPNGAAFNEVRLELGSYPEVEATQAKQMLAIPSTVNGKLEREATFRFRARQGEELIFETMAKRAGADVDSFLEVLDANGKSIETKVIRPVWETTTTLRDHDSAARGIRINSWNFIRVGDYVQIGAEILRVEEMPRGPDADMFFENLNGQRIAYFNTSPEAHAIDSPVYKVQVHPPGSQFTPNGLPLTRLYARNDDGGPGYGKDSLLRFQAPRDGEYILRLTDVRGNLAKAQPYRLTARRPEEDFRISFTPANPNVPPGSAVPLNVSVRRIDGFRGPISVSVEGLPPGITASPAVVAPDQVFTTILLKSENDLKAANGKAFPITVKGHAVTNGGKQLARTANPEDRLKLVSTMPTPDVRMAAITKVVEIEAGGEAQVSLSVERMNGFKGRVPVAVLNLPPAVRVADIGLNGVMVNEDETKRTFTLYALPTAEGMEQVIYVAGNVETRSPQQNLFAAPEAILLRVKPAKKTLSSNLGITGELVKE
jgi:hypothetical protein